MQHFAREVCRLKAPVGRADKLKEELTFRAPALRQMRHKKLEPQLMGLKTLRA